MKEVTFPVSISGGDVDVPVELSDRDYAALARAVRDQCAYDLSDLEEDLALRIHKKVLKVLNTEPDYTESLDGFEEGDDLEDLFDITIGIPEYIEKIVILSAVSESVRFRPDCSIHTGATMYENAYEIERFDSREEALAYCKANDLIPHIDCLPPYEDGQILGVTEYVTDLCVLDEDGEPVESEGFEDTADWNMLPSGEISYEWND